MAGRNRATFVANTAIELGTTVDGNISTTELNRVMSKAVNDVTKYAPLELVKEAIIVVDVTAEAQTLSSDAATLSNKPVEWGSVTVTSDPAGTTYVEDTDYTIDYIAGTIDTSMTGGTIGASDSILITYRIDRRIVDISSLLTRPIEITHVEYPVRSGKQYFSNIQVHGDYLTLTTQEGAGQGKVVEDQHIRLWYNASHTDPGDATSGSIPEYLDETVQMGVTGYGARVLSSKALQAALTALNLATTDLAKSDDQYVDSSFALALANTEVDKVAAVIAAMRGAPGKPIDDAETALALVTGHVTDAKTALGKLPASLDAATLSSNVALNAAVVELAASVTTITAIRGDAGEPLTLATAALNAAAAELALGNTALDAVATEITGAGSSIDDEIDEVPAIITLAQADLTLALKEFGTHGTPSTRNVDTYLDAGDAKLDTVPTGSSPEGVTRDYVRYAEAKMGSGNSHVQSAMAHVATGNLRISAAQQRFNGVQGHVQEAANRASVANGYNTEANIQIAHAQVILTEAQLYINQASVSTNIAAQRKEIAMAWVNEASQRLAAANAESNHAAALMQVADRYLAQAQGYLAGANGYLQEANGRIALDQIYLNKGRSNLEEAASRLQHSSFWSIEGDKRLDQYWRDLRDRTTRRSDPVMVSRNQPLK